MIPLQPLKHFFYISCIALLSSCQIPDKPSTETFIDIPSTWKASNRPQTSSTRISQGWLRDFNDAKLTKLVNEAMNKNPSLLASAERLKASQTNVINSRSDLLPSINGSGSGNRSRTNEDAAGGDGPTSSGTKSIGVSASWEIDLWKRLRDLNNASTADYEAATADFRATRLALAAGTASAWYNLISAVNQVTLAEDTLSSYHKVKKIIERNYKAGTLRAIDLQLSKNNVFNAERNLRIRLEDRDNAKRNLEIILGRYPSSSIPAPGTLPTIRPHVATGIPADMISRRPDMVQAKKELEASFHRALAAKKDILPSLALTGSASTSSPNYSDLLDIGFLTTSIAASISQTIFDAGVKRAEAEAAVTRNKAEIHDYAGVALNAFSEVESALASEKWLNEQEVYLRKELEQAALAESQSERDYAEGVDGIDIIDLLETQRRASNARSSLIDLQNQRIQNRISLHLALGGDYKTRP